MGLIPGFIRRQIAHRSNLLKIIDNIGWLFFDKILRMGVGLIVGIWIARYLGPDQFGLLNFAIAFVGIFGAVAGLGLQNIVVRDLVRDHSGKEETLGTAIILQLIGGLIAYCFILGAIFWIRPGDVLAQLLVSILGSAVLFKSSEVVIYWFESQVLSKYTVWVQNGCFLVFALIKAGLILNHASLVAFAWASMAEALLSALLLGLMLSMHGPKLWQLHFTFVRAKRLLKDSTPLLLSGIAIVIYMKIDQIMLGELADEAAVGIYSAAVRISEVWYFIPMMVATSIFPAILEVKKHSQVKYFERLQFLYDLMVWLSIAVAVPMTFLSTPIMKFLFGEDFAASGLVLSIHIWAALFVFLGVASTSWFLSEDQQILSLQSTSLGAIVNVALNFALIPSFGAVGAAIATVISYAVAAFLADTLHKETRPLFFMKMSALNLPASFLRLKRKI